VALESTGTELQKCLMHSCVILLKLVSHVDERIQAQTLWTGKKKPSTFSLPCTGLVKPLLSRVQHKTSVHKHKIIVYYR